jgi:hypothetical protein
MKQRLIKWAYGLVGGCIGGGAASVMSWLGLTTAKAIGIDVPQMNFKAMGVIFLSGVVTHAVAYLSKSPLPPLNGDTTMISRTETVVVK